MLRGRAPITAFKLLLLAAVLLGALSVGTATASAAPDLSTSVTDNQDPITAGTNLGYNIQIENEGTSATTATTTLTDTLPAGTTFVSMGAPGGWVCTTPAVGASGTVSCTMSGAISAGATANFNLSVHVDSSVADGSAIVDTATATTAGDSDTSNDSGTETTSVQASANLSVTNSDSPDPVAADSDLTYTIGVHNSGPSDAASVELSDELPSGTTFQSLSVPSGWSCNTPAVGAGGTVTCDKGSFGASATDSFTLVVHVAAGTPGATQFSDTANVTESTLDPDPDNNFATATTSVPAASDLSVTNVGSPDPAGAGTNITYTLTVTNNGPDALANARLTDNVPGGTTFVSVTGPTTCDVPEVGTTGTVRCDTGTLPSGASRVYTLTVHVDNDRASPITNTATVSATGNSDPTAGNNSAIASTMVATDSDLSVTNTDSPDPAARGGQLTYTISVANNGPAAAQNVSLSDTLPAGTTFASLDSPDGWACTTPSVGGTGTVSCTQDTLGFPVATQTFHLVVNVSLAAASPLSDTATVSSTTADGNPGNESAPATTTVTDRADLEPTMTDSPDPVLPNHDITYTTTVHNNGPSPAAAVSVEDTLPSGTTFVSSSPSTGSCGPPASGKVTCSFGTLASGSSASYTITVHVPNDAPDNSTPQNQAVASSSTSDPVPDNNFAAESTNVLAVADVMVSLTDSPDPVAAGSTVTYHVRVHDDGPSDAKTLHLSMPIPAGVTTYESATQTGGAAFSCTANTSVIDCNGASLPAGTDATFDLVLRVASFATAPFTVTPQVTSTTGDPNGNNNSASETTTVRPASTGGAKKPVKIKLGKPVERKSGAVVVPVTCTNQSGGKTCKTKLTLAFRAKRPKLKSISRSLTLRSGRKTTVVLTPSKKSRAKIVKIKRLPVKLTATRPPGKAATRSAVLRPPQKG